MNQISDSDSKDSDDGVRYKTESVRNKEKASKKSFQNDQYIYHDSSKYRRRSRSPQTLKSTRKYSRSPSPTSKSTYQRKGATKHKSSRKQKYSRSSSSDDGQNLKKFVQQTSKKREKIKSPFGRRLDEDSKESHKNSVEKQDNNKEEESSHNFAKSFPCPTEAETELCISHLRKERNKSDSQLKLEVKMEEKVFGPHLPLDMLDKRAPLGPVLPPGLRESPDSNLSQLKSEEEPYGPQLPPYVGPELPPHLKVDLENDKDNRNSEIIGPSLPHHLRQKLREHKQYATEEVTEREEIYGPLPTGVIEQSSAHKALEERALQLKIDQLEPKENKEPLRETWMIELPEAKAANFGLGPRQFRNRAGPDLSDRSSWTDVPGEKSSKKKGEDLADLRGQAELQELKKRDEEQELLTRKERKKEKSLLAIHQKKLKEQKKDESPSERRPFSRDIDLQVNRFDEAQKKAIMKKAQLLDDRFSTGKSKFL